MVVPMGMLQSAGAEAQKQAHGWLGPEHFLLALLAEPSIATETLADLGVTYDRFDADLRRLRTVNGQPLPAYDPKQGLRLNPAGQKLSGMARAFAIAGGSARPQALHWLLSMVYMDNAPATHLHAMGVSAAAILEALRRRGVAVPAVEPPIYRA